MKKVNFLLLILTLLCLWSVNIKAKERYIELNHNSKILGKEKKLAVILPRDYTEEKRYPVLYLLHSANGNYLTWHKVDAKLYELSREYELIIVTPDLDTSWLVDSPVKPESQYESYFIKELVPFIDTNYSTINSYRGRGLAGMSMGGHGAIVLASKYPELFGVASSMSGVLDLRLLPNTAGKKDVLGEVYQNPEAWNNNSAVFLADKIKTARRRPRIMFDVGLSDYVYDTNLAYHTTLKKLSIDHIFKVFPGTHDWGYWVSRLPDHLEYHRENLKKPEIQTEE